MKPKKRKARVPELKRPTNSRVVVNKNEKRKNRVNKRNPLIISFL
jgi:hypothetical protein